MTATDPRSLFDVSSKVVLITGASGGFGRACAAALAGAGARVMLTGRVEEKLEPLAAAIVADGGMAGYVAGRPDVPEDVQRVVSATIERFGGIDVLITAAGLNRVHPITEFPLEDWLEVMDVNVKGTWLACREVGRVMIEQGRGGKVILVSSTRGRLGMANYSAYSPSKAAVDLLARTLACEWGPHRINVNAIAPTAFRSPLNTWMFDEQASYKKIEDRIPLGRLGEPDDFIGTVIYLASRASDFVTGTVLYVDGGYTAG